MEEMSSPLLLCHKESDQRQVINQSIITVKL